MQIGKRPIIALLGPTGVGKTALSIEVATRLGNEIISCDSRQVYKPLTIGTAKPEPEELAAVPHHFINELDLTDPFSAGRFAETAHLRTESIVARGSRPLIVGGSTLYVEALIHGLSEIPPTTKETRERLMQRVHHGEVDRLYAELVASDPETAATLDASKTQRIVRALEVLIDTGIPLSYYHRHRKTGPYRFYPVVLTRPREELYNRINARVDAMLDRGLLDEVESILSAGFSPSLNALKTIGYREPIAYLRGQIDRPAMVATLKRNSRRYAKRQLTWYRRHPDYEWIDLSLHRTEDIVDRLITFLQ